MRILEGIAQGSDAWHAERARRFTASEAPAMMGASKYTSRSQLLQQKATGIVPEVSAHKQALFDKGHEAEAGSRAIVEDSLGEDLFPATAVHDTDDRLLASFDGVTMLEDVIYEHKLWSESLAAQVRAGELEPHYYWQLEQQLLISGAERAIFVCSDGTRERFALMEYRPVPGRREALLAGWDQFAADLANYTAPAERAPEPVAAKKASLPALVVDVEGKVVQSNLIEWKTAAIAHIETINTTLVTDQDFADADEAVKWCETSKARLQEVKAAALARMTSVEQLFSAIDEIVATMDGKRLTLANLVKARKEARKNEIVEKGRTDLARHVAAKEQALRDLLPEGTVVRVNLMPPVVGDFASAIKNKRSFANMESAVSDEVALRKVEANKAHELREKNLRALQGKARDHKHLFADWLDLIGKDVELVEMTIGQRIQAEKEAEERRLAAERERIRREEEERARAAAAREQQEREAAERRQREEQEAAQRRATIEAQEQQQREARAEQERRRQEANAAGAAAMEGIAAAREAGDLPEQLLDAMETAATGIITDLTLSRVADAAKPSTVVQMPTKAPAGPPTLKLGEIKRRIAPLDIDAAGLTSLGFPVVKQEGATKLWHEHQFPAIVDSLIRHLEAARNAQQRVA